MNLARWEPLRDLLTLQDRMNRIINEPYLRFNAPVEPVAGWFPPVDVHEEAERIVFRAELPGVGRDDIDVSVENGTLTLRGEKKQESEVSSDGVFRQERFYGSFSRSFVLPAKVDPDRIHASYRDGVLEVVLPKAAEARPRKITVVSAGDGAHTGPAQTKVRATS
jgi:HSP20 family protein